MKSIGDFSNDFWVEAYLGLNFELLRSFQDLPGFKRKMGLKSWKINTEFFTRYLNEESLEMDVANSRKNSRVQLKMTWMEVNKKSQNLQCETIYSA